MIRLPHTATEKTGRHSKSERLGWYFYDWANSSYPLVINSAIFPIFYGAVTTSNGSSNVSIFGLNVDNSALYAYTIALSYLIVSLITPVLSGVADFAGKKKLFLRVFSTLGSVSCAGLFFFSKETLPLGLLMVLLASVGFSGSLVFYNAFLPEIAPPEDQDQVSARGFAMGYAGSSILLIAILTFLLKPEWFGLNYDGLSNGQIFLRLAPWAFVAVALWWQGFAQITFSRLRERTSIKTTSNLLLAGLTELSGVVKALKSAPQLKTFLLAFFFYSMGVQTVILMSTFFGDQELKMESDQLITVLLVVQFIAVAGSYLFSWMSSRLGNISTLIVAIITWICICICARFVATSFQFICLSGLVGLVLGGIQAISRSTYSKLLPATRDHASFFSFYDICEKVGIVVGMFSYGWIAQVTGSMRNSILSLIAFFVVGLIFLLKLRPLTESLAIEESN